MNFEALGKLSHGVYVLTTRLGEKDNGCIIDAVMQVTSMPERIAICVNKGNLTNGMIRAAKQFNLSVLTEEAPLEVYQHFGFQSGREVNKFEGCEEEVRSANGVRYIPKYTNALISGSVVDEKDMGTHTMFIADVTEAKVISDSISQTYGGYQRKVKNNAK